MTTQIKINIPDNTISKTYPLTLNFKILKSEASDFWKNNPLLSITSAPEKNKKNTNKQKTKNMTTHSHQNKTQNTHTR